MSNWTRSARIVFVALAVSILVVPVALAKGKPPGVGKPATGPGCKPAVSVILKGTLTAVSASGDLSVTLLVDKANRHGKVLVGQTVTVKVNGDTKIRRNGKATLGDFKTGPADRVMVKLRVCKKSVSNADTLDEWTNGSTGILATTFAKRVVAHPAQPA